MSSTCCGDEPNLSELSHYEQKICHVLHGEMERSRFSRRVAEYFAQIEQTAEALQQIVWQYAKSHHVLLH